MPENEHQKVKLREVCVPHENVQPKRTPEKRFRYVSIGSIDNETYTILNIDEFRGADAPSRARRQIKAGDVLFSTVRPYLKNIAQVPQWLDNELTSTGICVLRPSERVLPRFLFYSVLNSEFVRRVSGEMDGALYPAVSDTDILEQEISLPPLETQKRIVARLDALTTRNRKAREHLDAIPPLIDQFRQSVLAAAFRGDLTADWRAQNPDVEPASQLLERIRVERRRQWIENYAADLTRRAEARALKRGQPWTEADARAYMDKKRKAGAKKYTEPEPVDPEREGLPKLPEGWEWVRLEELIVNIEAGKSPKARPRPAQEGEIGVLKVSAVSWGEFDPLENKALHAKTSVDPSNLVRPGDLLFSRANTTALVGAVVLVRQTPPNLMLSDKTLRLVPVSGFPWKDYLLYALRAPAARRHMEAHATGTSDSMRNLSQDKILSTPIPLAPESEVEVIADKCRKVTAHMQLMEKAAEHANDYGAILLHASLAAVNGVK